MRKLRVQVCRCNQMAARADLLDLLRSDPHQPAVVEAAACLDRCTLCEKWPFALVNGQLCSAETCEGLVELIRQETAFPVPNAKGKS